MSGLLQCIFRVSRKSLQRLSLTRGISSSKPFLDSNRNYEGDGKTTVTVLNKQYRDLIMVDSFSTTGFRLNNGIFVVGPMAVFPRTVLQWNIDSMEEMVPGALSLFTLLEPKLDFLVIGSGDKLVFPNRPCLDFLKARNLHVEVLPTKQACSIFNFLNVEGRCVAGAFLPPVELIPFEEDLKMLDGTTISKDKHGGFLI